MRSYRFAAALALSIAAATAGCAVATPASSGTADATVRTTAAQSALMPAVFAASLMSAPAGTSPGDSERIGLYSTQVGRLVRWLTPLRPGVYTSVLNVHGGWVYFLRSSGSSTAVYRVAEAGGPVQLVQAGATDYAISQDGAGIAYVTSADHHRVVELVVKNLVNQKHNTIVLATNPGGDNNWPPDIEALSWAPDDTQLAVTYNQTAAISTVLVFNAFTSTTAGDGRPAPAPCELDGSPLCTEYGSGYLADGALTYVVSQVSASGDARMSLYAFRDRVFTPLLRSFGDGIPYLTPRGQAIWVDGPAAPKQAWTIWRWTGGAPVKVLTLPPLGATLYYGVGGVVW
jgi:hypothetical protein